MMILTCTRGCWDLLGQQVTVTSWVHLDARIRKCLSDWEAVQHCGEMHINSEGQSIKARSTVGVQLEKRAIHRVPRCETQHISWWSAAECRDRTKVPTSGASRPNWFVAIEGDPDRKRQNFVEPFARCGASLHGLWKQGKQGKPSAAIGTNSFSLS